MKRTLQEITDIYNQSEDLVGIDLEAIIEESGFTSDCHEEFGICHSDIEKVIINDDGVAVVYPI